jgi:hypothetical protein
MAFVPAFLFFLLLRKQRDALERRKTPGDSVFSSDLLLLLLLVRNSSPLLLQLLLCCRRISNDETSSSCSAHHTGRNGPLLLFRFTLCKTNLFFFGRIPHCVCVCLVVRQWLYAAAIFSEEKKLLSRTKLPLLFVW